MMQTMPCQTTVYRGTATQESDHQAVATHQPLTPAERIALTIVRLNNGLDMMDGMARTSLARCTRGVIRSHGDQELEADSRRVI
jgi:hypothetical protein